MAKNQDDQLTTPDDVKPKATTEELYVLTDGYGEPLKLRGAKVTVTAAEAEHGRKIGALGTIEDLKNAELAAESSTSDDSLRAMSPLELLAWLASNSDDESLARVETLEARRSDGPREVVTANIETVRRSR